MRGASRLARTQTMNALKRRHTQRRATMRYYIQYIPYIGAYLCIYMQYTIPHIALKSLK